MLKNLPDLSFYNIETETNKKEFHKRIKECLINSDAQELQNIIEERINNSTYLSKIQLRNNIEEELKSIDEDIEIAKGNVKGPDGKKSVCYVDVREHSLKYRELYEPLALLKKNISEYRLLTSIAVKHLSTFREQEYEKNNIISTYSSNHLHEWVKSKKYEYKSCEWEQQQLNGIGGSDIAKILRADPDNTKSAAYKRELLLKKLGLEQKQPEEYEENIAITIGNNWESYILQQYAINNPEKSIAVCSTLWQGEGINDYYRAKFDGLELDNDGKPISIIEIKTGTISEEWGDDIDFENAPENYLLQSIWYAKNAGLDKAVLIAILDDYDYREYDIDMNDARVIERWTKMKKEVHEFWTNILAYRDELEQGINTVQRRKAKGFTKTLNKANIEKECEKISAYSEIDYQLIFDNLSPILVELRKQKAEQETIQKTLIEFYTEHDPSVRSKPLIGIDIETNALSAKQGRIIETGIVLSHSNGQQDIEYSSLHDIPDLSKKGVGIGMTEVHRITLSMVDGKPSFDEPDVQEKVLSLLKQGVLVAHNAKFEKSFLIVNLKGFAEALDNDEIQILDTMNLTSNIILESPNDKLQSFSEYNGVAYEGAHNATTDTVIMMKALRIFQEGLYKEKCFVKRSATDTERAEAVIAGQNQDAERL